MLTEEEWARIKGKWIAEGRIPDDDGYYHYTCKDSTPVRLRKNQKKMRQKQFDWAEVCMG